MSTKKNSILVGKLESWSGLTTDAHLTSVGIKNPTKLGMVINEMLINRYGNTLEDFLNMFPIRRFDSDDEYTWEIAGEMRRNIPLREARDEDGSVIDSAYGSVGRNGAPFYLVFEEDMFHDGEVLWGNLNEVYPMRVLSEPRYEGSLTVYKVSLMNGRNDGIPAERLLAGEKFSYAYAPVEKSLSRKVGGVSHASPIGMRNEFTTVRIQHKVEGNKGNIKMPAPYLVSTYDKYNKKTAMWIDQEEWAVESKFKDYKNNAMAFSTSNRNANGEYTDFGKSGNPIKVGAGLFEQLSYGNVVYYSKFSIEMVEEALIALSLNKKEIADRVFVMKTGEYGALQFHKAVLDTTSGWKVLSDGNPSVINKANSPLHQNSLSAGFQFTEFRAPNGIVLKVEVDKMYDDDKRNKIEHPNGGFAFSYRYDIFDLGSKEDSNINKCVVGDGAEARSVVVGIRNPWASVTGNFSGNNGYIMSSHDEDSATIHRMADVGVVVYDPTRAVSFIPAILENY